MDVHSAARCFFTLRHHRRQLIWRFLYTEYLIDSIDEFITIGNDAPQTLGLESQLQKIEEVGRIAFVDEAVGVLRG